MIGLEYILSLYNMQHQDLADKLNIKKQNINLWIKSKQKIPGKHLPKLQDIFFIPEEYFTMQLTESDKLEIQAIKFKNDSFASYLRLKDATEVAEIQHILEYEDRDEMLEALAYSEPFTKLFVDMKKMDITVKLSRIKQFVEDIDSYELGIFVDNQLNPCSPITEKLIDLSIALDDIISNYIESEVEEK